MSPWTNYVRVLPNKLNGVTPKLPPSYDSMLFIQVSIGVLVTCSVGPGYTRWASAKALQIFVELRPSRFVFQAQHHQFSRFSFHKGFQAPYPFVHFLLGARSLLFPPQSIAPRMGGSCAVGEPCYPLICSAQHSWPLTVINT